MCPVAACFPAGREYNLNTMVKLNRQWVYTKRTRKLFSLYRSLLQPPAPADFLYVHIYSLFLYTFIQNSQSLSHDFKMATMLTILLYLNH